MITISHTRDGKVLYQKTVTEEERQQAIERYERTHPEAARGTLTDCCGSSTPGKEIDRDAQV